MSSRTTSPNLPAPQGPSSEEQYVGLLRIKKLVLDSVTSHHSRRAYDKALTDFLNWYAASPRWRFSRAIVQEYRVTLEKSGLSASTINVRLAAVRKLALEAADNGLLSNELAVGIARVRGARRQGVRVGNWLSLEQVRDLLAQPDAKSAKGKRDRAMLGILIGCGLRRAELISLRWERIQIREGRWVIVDMLGKGNRVRTIPVPAWVKVLLDEWGAVAGIRVGLVFRAVHKGSRIGEEGLTEKVVWFVVRDHAQKAGLPHISPHDLRRTCAKLCRANGGELEQIQLLLGHASVQTTERYLGTKQNLQDAVNDRIDVL